MKYALHPNGKPRKLHGKESAAYVATLLNPVDHRLYDVVSFGSTVYIVAPMPNEDYEDPDRSFLEYGHGSYDESDEKEIDSGYYPSNKYSGSYYRSHTPDGVTKEGAGLGLVLYSGLSLATTMGLGAAGVFSEENLRSTKASKWWKAQTERGFASEEDVYVTGSGSVEVEIDEEMLGDIQYLTSVGDFGEEIRHAENVSITEGPDPSSVYVEVYVEGSIRVSYLPTKKVAESKIVIAWNSEDDDLNPVMEDSIYYPPAEILAEIDMSTVGDPSLILNIWDLLQESDDVTEAQKKRFLQRVPRASMVEITPEILEMMGQQKFPYEELMKESQAVAANPRGKIRHSSRWKAYYGDLSVA